MRYRISYFLAICLFIVAGLTIFRVLYKSSTSVPIYDSSDDLEVFAAGYFKQKKSAKKELQDINTQLLKAEQRGSDTLCARQIYRELRWLISYTVNFKRFQSRLSFLKEIISGGRHPPNTFEQSSVDGSWGACHEEWFFKLDVSSDAINALAERNLTPRYKTKFLDRINSPILLIAYLDSILISNPSLNGKDNRKELNYAISALLRFVIRERPTNYRYHPKLKETLRKYLIEKLQNPKTGFWGAWYQRGKDLIKTDDLSVTFHVVSYLNGDVPLLDKIAMTTYHNRFNPYPYGLMEDGFYTNHHNYDAIRLFRYGWPKLSSTEKTLVQEEIQRMLNWCLGSSIQKDGSFKISAADDSLADAFYFGVSFLDEVGYFNRQKRFWTSQDFSGSASLRERIKQRIVLLRKDDLMLRDALEKLSN